jgi:CheY-like chemotaxis protein
MTATTPEVAFRQIAFVRKFVVFRPSSVKSRRSRMITADEILNSLSEGIAVVDTEERVMWCNPAFRALTEPDLEPIGSKFYRLFGAPEIIERDDCPMEAARKSHIPEEGVLRVEANKYLGMNATPIADADGIVARFIVLLRDVTREILQEQKLKAIYEAGEKLSDLSAQDIQDMDLGERTDLLTYNIIRDLKELLGVRNVEIRLLEAGTDRLVPLLSEGMTPIAETRDLRVAETGQGVTGHVAATRKSYLCRDTSRDPHYLQGAADAQSSYTIPLLDQDQVIGTLNVEADKLDAFTVSDRQFLDVYAQNLAQALHTLDLLQAESSRVYHESIEKVWRSIALPMDEMLSDATFVLDRYVGHDEDIIRRLRQMIIRARDIRTKIKEIESVAPPATRAPVERSTPPLSDMRILFVDSDEGTRRAAHHLLGQWGATVETARDAAEALALARGSNYNLAICDIFLPDKNGYEIFVGLRAIHPKMPIVLMTGFAYDKHHSIPNVKSHEKVAPIVLYKPFRADRILDAVQKGLGGHVPGPDKTTGGESSEN